MIRDGRSLPRTLRLFFIASLVLCSWLAFGTGCRPPVDEQEPGPLQIGVLADMASAEGPLMRAGTKLALEELEAGRGLLVEGQRATVELLFEDTHGTPTGAVEGARRLIQQGVVAIIGPGNSSSAILVAGVVENARIPMVNGSSTHPQTTAGRGFTFRINFTDTFQGRALGRFAIEGLGTKRAAVLFDAAGAYNRHLAAVFRQSFEELGGQVVASEGYVTGERDFTSYLGRIRRRDPELLFLPNYANDVPDQVRQARQLGIDAIFLGSDAWSAILSHVEVPELEGGFFSRPWHYVEADAKPAERRLVERHRELHDSDPANRTVLAFDALGVLFDAISRAGPEPEAIRDALADTADYPGIVGPITYRGHGGDPPKEVLILRAGVGGAELRQRVSPFP